MCRTARLPRQAVPCAACYTFANSLPCTHSHQSHVHFGACPAAQQGGYMLQSSSARPSRPVGLSAFKLRKEVDVGVLAQGRAGMESAGHLLLHLLPAFKREKQHLLWGCCA